MEPLKPFVGKVAAVPVENIDTDQIIPARFLKTTSAKGLGESLFFGLALCPEWVAAARLCPE